MSQNHIDFKSLNDNIRLMVAERKAAARKPPKPLSINEIPKRGLHHAPIDYPPEDPRIVAQKPKLLSEVIGDQEYFFRRAFIPSDSPHLPQPKPRRGIQKVEQVLVDIVYDENCRVVYRPVKVADPTDSL